MSQTCEMPVDCPFLLSRIWQDPPKVNIISPLPRKAPLDSLGLDCGAGDGRADTGAENGDTGSP